MHILDDDNDEFILITMTNEDKKAKNIPVLNNEETKIKFDLKSNLFDLFDDDDFKDQHHNKLLKRN